jgi:hypothetical protein
LNIFDAYGKLRALTAEEQATVESFSDGMRADLFQCIAAVTARDECEARMFAARDDTRKKEAAIVAREQLSRTEEDADRAGIEAQTAAARAAGLATVRRLAEIKAVSAAQRKGYVSPKPAVADKAKAAIDEAAAALAASRVELQRSTADLRALEIQAGECLNAWRMHLKIITRDDLFKEYVARGIADRMARVARGESPDLTTNAPTVTCEWEAARGKRKPRPLIR